MAPPSGNVSRPGRALAVLGVLIVVLFLAIVGGNIAQPSKWGSDFKVKLGLDLTSGTTVALEAQAPKGVSSAQFATDMTQAKNIMESRVNGAGFTEAQVQQQGSNIINVAVPGANSQKVIDLVGTTAQLLFRQVLLVAPNTVSATPTPTPSASGSATATPSASPSATASTKAKVRIAPGSAAASQRPAGARSPRRPRRPPPRRRAATTRRPCHAHLGAGHHGGREGSAARPPRTPRPCSPADLRERLEVAAATGPVHAGGQGDASLVSAR